MSAELAHLSDDRGWNQFLGSVYSMNWVAYGEGPLAGTEGSDAVLKYLARHVVGTTIWNHRLISDDGEKITYWAPEPKQPGGWSLQAKTSSGELTRRRICGMRSDARVAEQLPTSPLLWIFIQSRSQHQGASSSSVAGFGQGFDERLPGVE